ncbi:hypothetical protein BX616_010397 [Lobosporangium transversale]|uniref:Uncharacterized protein n=1 Tax=Lobosporangium transversale TaxID=64571 RepID=A0A1Y2GDM9_9FUNG|nr:hypothetical protein BCR41DRAFT_148427 [Lobosporangium transversale]KAF9918060.1 hypothetical protein BX616_010397 [Lobosporangium transversale]ORZ07963.1 hypothetical protein BCR41DRAFT_148427 [Lobosporangium transversale]|eukprot:XP_021878197.1 hypothetical protein BCR41DRAFT_148427 [Lobosporangium transversale]
MSLNAHDITPLIAPPRRPSMNYNDCVCNITKVINRTQKPPTTSTSTSSATNVNNIELPPTSTPLSAGPRRKAISNISIMPRHIPKVSPNTKPPYETPPKNDNTVRARNHDRDINPVFDDSYSNSGQGDRYTHQQQWQELHSHDPNQDYIYSKDCLKRRASLNSPTRVSAMSSCSNSIHHRETMSNMLYPLVSTKRGPFVMSNDMGHRSVASPIYNMIDNITPAEGLPNQRLNTKSGNVDQKFGELLNVSSSFVGSKKRGSDTCIGTEESLLLSPPSTSLLSMKREGGNSGSFFGKNCYYGTSPSTSKISLLSKVFGNQNQQQGRYGDDASKRSVPWANNIGASKILAWEMHKSVPSSGYENESFALWIRPNTQSRTVISGADVEKAESAAANRNGKDEAATSRDDERQKKYCPELEDMKVLEEVLDFAIIILMRASASLYPFISSAYPESIPLNIRWKLLQYEDRGWRYYNVRTLKEYQDYVMVDIGFAIQAMIEIYDQQERPYNHPDNIYRDAKLSQRPIPVFLPPDRTRLSKLMSNNGANKGRSNGNSHIPATCSSPSTLIPPSVIASTSLKKHRRHSSVPVSKLTISGMLTSIKQSLPSPMSLHSPLQDGRSGFNEYNNSFYSSYPDGTPFAPSLPARSALMSYTQAEPTEHSYYYSHSGAGTPITATGGSFLPQSIQSIISSFRGGSVNGSSSLSLAYGSNANITIHSPKTQPIMPSKQEEKRQQMEYRWRVDIMRRKAHLRAWACRCFLDLYDYSLIASYGLLEEEFKDLYRIISAIVEVDANEKSHEVLEATISQAREQEKEPFKLRYSQYKTKAPTGKEIREANKEAIRRFEMEYADQALRDRMEYPIRSVTDNDDDSSKLDNCITWLRRPLISYKHPHEPQNSNGDGCSSSCLPGFTSAGGSAEGDGAYDCMELYGLQNHTIWEPLLDRLTKFDTTHHELDARNIFQFLRRMSLYSPGVADERNLLSDESREEMLAVLWAIEKCVQERPDYQQSPTWFRLSSSASAVQAICDAGGVIPYLKGLKEKDIQGRDPILLVNPVTLTGYFKRLLKEGGGLLLKETTVLFVELARPATDNGDFWNLEKLSRIDRALLYRVICLDQNRGQVFLRISRVMDQILESSPKDMELDAFALSKMVQVVELSGVLDLKALRRWNGAWSAIILGYM